jgi:hypothetical protein
MLIIKILFVKNVTKLVLLVLALLELSVQVVNQEINFWKKLKNALLAMKLAKHVLEYHIKIVLVVIFHFSCITIIALFPVRI